MAKLDYEMPEVPAMEGEEEEVDLLMEEKPEGEGPDLGGYSDEELIDELKARGFDIEESEGEEPEMPEMEEEEEVELM